jgi:ankyrin repeat protein
MLAAQYGDDKSLQIVRALIEAGADLDIQSNDGWTALAIAAANGCVNNLKVLIEAGADLDRAIKWATENNKAEALKTLKEAM